MVVGRAAYLGMGSSVRENLKVGERATLGMGAALLGRPARRRALGRCARPARSAGVVLLPAVDGGRLGSALDEPAPPSGDWTDLVVICGTTFWSGHRLLDQHMAEHLAAFVPVLYIDPPDLVPLPVPERRRGDHALAPGLHVLGPQLAVWSSHVPSQASAGRQGDRRSRCCVGRCVAAMRLLGSPRVSAVIVPSLNPLFGALGERTRVFYAKDDYVAGAELMGMARRRLTRRAHRQPRDADLVVAVSPTLVESMSQIAARTLLVPTTAVTWSSSVRRPTRRLGRVRRPVVGFVGQLSERIDVAILERLARAGTELLLIGPRQRTLASDRVDALLRQPNVTWTGAVAY